jgi:hypothetical protein
MKAVLISALVMISGISVYLVQRGTALRPAGVIKPSEIQPDIDVIGRSLALRLFPEFHSSQNVVWRIEKDQPELMRIVQIAHLNYQTPQKPRLIDNRNSDQPDFSCDGSCWFVFWADSAALSDSVAKFKQEPSIEIFIHYFNRDEAVPSYCEDQKIMEISCIRPVSVREVRRKMKTDKPHFFMRRYLDNEFFLYLEKSPAP